jgi:hypothetical protein
MYITDNAPRRAHNQTDRRVMLALWQGSDVSHIDS